MNSPRMSPQPEEAYEVMENAGLAHREETAEWGFPLPLDASAAKVARQAVSEKLAGFPLSNELLEDILLVTSELVTNAFEHGAGPIRLQLSQKAATIGIKVYDGGERHPVLKKSEPLTARSRGLMLVKALASGGWGSADEPKGKYVWADFTIESRLR